jgi:hypothetical protein
MMISCAWFNYRQQDDEDQSDVFLLLRHMQRKRTVSHGKRDITYSDDNKNDLRNIIITHSGGII